MPATKRYDERYFQRWYRESGVGVGQRGFVARKVRLAVAAAEYVLDRELRNVLDVGCGEAQWLAILRALRPRAAYTGLDSSVYAVRRFGRKRGIRLASLGQVGRIGLKGPFDLVVCADVLHYVPTPEVRAGLAAMRALCGGVAFVEAFTGSDDVEGDDVAFQRRSTATYRKLLAAAGFVPLGLHLYTTRATARTLVALERGVGR